MLDNSLIEIFTEENFKNEYWEYKQNKTDIYTNKIKIRMGVDGLKYKTFEKQLDKIAKDTCKRIHEGRYFFSPFREVEVPKPPYINVKDAKRAAKQNGKEGDNIRVLSIATIRDILVQRLLYQSIEQYCEQQFNNLGEDVSFAYRKGKSTHNAVKKIYSHVANQQFEYVLDVDIKGFFDNIPHDKLLKVVKGFFGEDNSLLITYLRRFISVDRVRAVDYRNEREFHTKKPKRTIRSQGIPQGGVLSGVIANIYMHQFDSFMVNEVGKTYGEIKYTRYADDFVVLLKDSKRLEEIYKIIQDRIGEMGLEIHPLGEKSEKVDLSPSGKQRLEFLGFTISTKGIGIKEDNIIKFKRRINKISEETKIYKNSPKKGLEILLDRISFKILGNKNFKKDEICIVCGGKIKSRNWVSYFIIITDLNVLKRMDTWVRKEIYRQYFHKTGRRLQKKELLQYNIPSLEKEYYIQKKDLKKHKICHCHLGGTDPQYSRVMK